MTADKSQTTADPCEWELVDSDFGTWESSCENVFVIHEGTPSENEMHFCCYCGRPLKEVIHAD